MAAASAPAFRKAQCCLPTTVGVLSCSHAVPCCARDVAHAAAPLQGLLNGREIFLSDNFVALDDANAGDDDEYRREDDDEARINDMYDQVSGARRGQRQAPLPAA